MKSRILRRIAAAVLATAAISPAASAKSKLNVVTTTQDIAYIASRVGGDRVKVEALAKGYENLHYISARPDFILKLRDADVFAEIGMDMEVGWTPPLLRQSRNAKIQKDGPGYCDTSAGIRVLQVPASADRSAGDVHAFGNPHYWPDPINAGIMARNLRDAMIRVDPAHRTVYNRNFKAFYRELRAFTIAEYRKFAPYRGLKVVEFHREFTYLAHRFKFNIVASIEEKPGVPPSATYMEKVIEIMKRENIKIILIAPFSNPRYARAIARRTGAQVLVMPISVGSQTGIRSYRQSIGTMLAMLRKAADKK